MSTPARILKYKVGDVTSSGETIAFIYGHSTTLIVFRDKNDKIQYETSADALTRTESLVQQEYDRLSGRMASVLPVGKKRENLRDELAQALFVALSESDERKALKYFENVAQRIAEEAHIEARFTYVLAGSVTGCGVLVVGGLVAYVFSRPEVDSLALGAAAGAVGAWASILSRASRLEIGAFEIPRNLHFQGLTRALLGMTFGMFAVVAIKTGQLFPAASDSMWTIALSGFIGGWSERFVPEIISKIESRAAKAAISNRPSVGS